MVNVCHYSMAPQGKTKVGGAGNGNSGTPGRKQHSFPSKSLGLFRSGLRLSVMQTIAEVSIQATTKKETKHLPGPNEPHPRRGNESQ